MSVNNFDNIRDMLEFPDENSFYFLQVLKRRKDNPDLGKDMKHIADYYIYSLEQFDELKPRIIAQCDVENARAYFRINRRDAKKVAMQVLKRTVDYIMSEDYRAVKNAFASCAGEFHSDPDKKWIVDVIGRTFLREWTRTTTLISSSQKFKNLLLKQEETIPFAQFQPKTESM